MRDEQLPDSTLQAIARTFYNEGLTYGFGFQDYVRFVNHVLDLAMSARERGVFLSDRSALPVRGERVGIRACAPGDLDRLRGWLEEPEGRYFLTSRAGGRPLELDGLLDDPANVLGIITLPDDTPVGAMLYVRHDPDRRTAELRKIVGESALRGMGLGTEASRLWIGYGLRGMGLQRIELVTLASNHRNVRLNEQLGFRVEGILRDAVSFDGRAHDLLQMSLSV